MKSSSINPDYNPSIWQQGIRLLKVLDVFVSSTISTVAFCLVVQAPYFELAISAYDWFFAVV